MSEIVIRSAYIYYLMRVKRGSLWEWNAEEFTVESRKSRRDFSDHKAALEMTGGG